jgi:hypothetical protein
MGRYLVLIVVYGNGSGGARRPRLEPPLRSPFDWVAGRGGGPGLGAGEPAVRHTLAELDLAEGDQFVVTVEDDRIVLTPTSVIPDDQAWFWTPEWQAKEAEVDEATARGERGAVFGAWARASGT